MNPIVISRSEKESVLIEGSVNAVRISIQIKQVRALLVCVVSVCVCVYTRSLTTLPCTWFCLWAFVAGRL